MTHHDLRLKFQIYRLLNFGEFQVR